jgi:hypothetical protein
MAPKRRKKPKTALEKMSDKRLLKEIREDLHALLDAESAMTAKPKKRKG